jgi:Flp pilus assembly protein TadD
VADHKQLYFQGLNHLAQGKLDEALARFQQSVDERPDFLEGHLGVSQACERKGMLDEAIVAVKRAIAINAGDPLVHTSLSRLYQQKGMIAEAEMEMALSRRLQTGG